MNMEKEVKAEKKRLLVLRESMRNEREAESEFGTKLPDRDRHRSDFQYGVLNGNAVMRTMYVYVPCSAKCRSNYCNP